jgi:hypothetical protein
VAEELPGGHEERTRIVCHLPLNDAAEHQAVDAVFSYLEQLRTQPLGVKGYTHSAARPPAHFGAWWSSSRRQWIREKVVLCLVDYKVNFNDQHLTRVLANLKDAIGGTYSHFTGKPQEDYWVVAHHIVR